MPEETWCEGRKGFISADKQRLDGATGYRGRCEQRSDGKSGQSLLGLPGGSLQQRESSSRVGVGGKGLGRGAGGFGMKEHWNTEVNYTEFVIIARWVLMTL